MSMNAVALLRVSLEKVKSALGEAAPLEDGPKDAVWLKGPESAVAFVGLEDAVLLYTGGSLRDIELDEFGEALRDLLGDLLDAHDDERGVLLFPDRARPDDATTYDAVVEEAGDLGDWIRPPADVAPAAPVMPPGLEAMMGQMMGAMGGDPSQMGGLWEQAQKIMANPEMQAQLLGAAQNMMSQMQTPEGGMDLSNLAEQAQTMMEDDPELVKRLQNHLSDDDGGASTPDEEK